MVSIIAKLNQAISLGRHQQLALEAGWDKAAQFQRFYGDLAAGLGHGAGVRFAVAVASGAFDLYSILAPDTVELVRKKDKGALYAVEPVAGNEHTAGQRLAALREFRCGDGLLYLLGHGFAPGKRRPPEPVVAI